MLSSTYSRVIEWGDCDPLGIVFNPNFFAFFDHGTSTLYEAAGWAKPILLERFNAAGCPLVTTRANFLAPCSFGDQVTVRSSITAVRRSSFEISHELRKGDILCVEGFEARVWTVRDSASGGFKSAPLPPELVARFEGAETR